MKKKIRWGNWLSLILFAGSVGLFIGDVFTIMIGNSLTWLGFITFMINMFIMCSCGVYIWEVCYEK